MTVSPRGEIHKDFIANLTGNTKVTVDNTQPFPIYGFLNLKWVIPTQVKVSDEPKQQTKVKLGDGPKKQAPLKKPSNIKNKF